jgi:hypothetical protein
MPPSCASGCSSGGGGAGVTYPRVRAQVRRRAVLAVTWAALPLFGRVDQSRRPAVADIIVEPIIVVQPADASM